MKKNWIALPALIIGLILGYLVAISNRPTLPINKNVAKENSKSYGFLYPPDVTILNPLAKSMIADFDKLNNQDINNNRGGLYCLDQNNKKVALKGFIIKKTSLMDIFAKNPKWTGLRVYFAKHPDYIGQDNYRLFTFIFTATVPKKGDKGNDDDSDPIYDHVDPCPQACGNLGN